MNKYSFLLNSIKDNNIFGFSIDTLMNLISLLLQLANLIKLLSKYILQNIIILVD